MKMFAGVMFLIFGLAAFGSAVAKLSSGASPAFAIGSLLPSALIIAAGIYIMTKSSQKVK